MESSVYDDCQFELDALGRSKPVETGKSICNMLRATSICHILRLKCTKFDFGWGSAKGGSIEGKGAIGAITPPPAAKFREFSERSL